MTLKNKAIIEKIINVLLNILIVIFSVVLLISIYTGLQVKILGHKYANFFGYSIFEVQTDSMKGVINAGDWIIIKLTQDVKIKDIITFENEDGDFITHRIVEVYKGTYITQGDVNSGKDKPIDESQVIGKLHKVIGGFGILRKTIFNPAVLIALIITLYLFNSVLKKETDNNKIIAFVIPLMEKLLVKLKTKKEVPVEKATIRTEELQIGGEIKNTLQEENIVSEDIPIPETQDINEESPIINDQEQAQDNGVVEEEQPSNTRQIIIDSLEEKVDLDKTSLYRVIPVDMSEVDDTLLEIAKNEMIEEQKEKSEQIIEEQVEIIEEQEETDTGLTNVDLELLKNNTRRNKTIIDTLSNMKKEEIDELIHIILEDDKLQTNEATIKNILITTYINAKYYNYYNNSDIEYKGKNLVTKIEKVLKLVASELIDEYSGSDTKYNEKVNLYTKILKLIANLDHGKDTITETKAKREFFKNEIKNYTNELDNQKIESIISEIIRIQKSYSEVLKYFFKKLETNTFYLEKEKIPTKKDLYAVDLKYNINFNKIYSDYIIDKTYKEGIVAEDAMSVFFSLLSLQIMNDMINADFKNKYILYIPNTLYKKEKKIIKVLKMVEDEYAKSHLIFLLTYEDLVENRNQIKKIKKLGFKFAVVIQGESRLIVKDRVNLVLVNHIFLNRKDDNFENILSFIPDELLDIIIYDDIISKIDSIGGDEK